MLTFGLGKHITSTARSRRYLEKKLVDFNQLDASFQTLLIDTHHRGEMSCDDQWDFDTRLFTHWVMTVLATTPVNFLDLREDIDKFVGRIPVSTTSYIYQALMNRGHDITNLYIDVILKRFKPVTYRMLGHDDVVTSGGCVCHHGTATDLFSFTGILGCNTWVSRSASGVYYVTGLDFNPHQSDSVDAPAPGWGDPFLNTRKIVDRVIGGVSYRPFCVIMPEQDQVVFIDDENTRLVVESQFDTDSLVVGGWLSDDVVYLVGFSNDTITTHLFGVVNGTEGSFVVSQSKITSQYTDHQFDGVDHGIVKDGQLYLTLTCTRQEVSSTFVLKIEPHQSGLNFEPRVGHVSYPTAPDGVNIDVVHDRVLHCGVVREIPFIITQKELKTEAVQVFSM